MAGTSTEDKCSKSVLIKSMIEALRLRHRCEPGAPKPDFLPFSSTTGDRGRHKQSFILPRAFLCLHEDRASGWNWLFLKRNTPEMCS